MRQFLLPEPEQYGWDRSPRLEAAGSRHKHKTPPLHITDNRTIAMVYHHTAPLQCTGVSPYHWNGVSPQHFNVLVYHRALHTPQTPQVQAPESGYTSTTAKNRANA